MQRSDRLLPYISPGADDAFEPDVVGDARDALGLAEHDQHFEDPATSCGR